MASHTHFDWRQNIKKFTLNAQYLIRRYWFDVIEYPHLENAVPLAQMFTFSMWTLFILTQNLFAIRTQRLTNCKYVMWSACSFFSLSLPFFSQNEWSLNWKFLRWHLKRVWGAVVYHWNSFQLHLICFFYESNGTNWRHDCQMHICLQWNWYMHASIE